ncbi:hypothetical protein C7459_10564 [Tumebacillus permanentifrigoris]|uniref:Phage integrase family protein n=1 Tax=Tumebacillus permanentifrigoris TaxID=378543 RepID=A0A316DBF0_9BACL|nr:hypothetical protein C7459_10564 [Tumebacillus permanentifrigoris]
MNVTQCLLCYFRENPNIVITEEKTEKEDTRVQAYRIMNTVANKVGLDEIGTHTLRKTFGYHLYQKTKDVAYNNTWRWFLWKLSVNVSSGIVFIAMQSKDSYK